MARVALVSVALAALALSACSRQTLLILTDQYWKASVLDTGRLKHQLHHLSDRSGTRVDTVVVSYGSAEVQKLVGAIEQRRGRVILLSPLYSQYGQALAARFHDRRFVSFSSPPGQPGLSNMTYLVSDPATVFTSAARRIVEHLTAAGAGSEPQEIAAVFSDDRSGQDALAAFREGLDSAQQQPAFSMIQVGGDADRSRLRSFLDSAQNRGAALYLLAAPSLDAYALDLLKNSTAPVVTLDWTFGATYSDKVLFSIDEDIPAALVKILEPMGGSADNQIRIPWDIVTGATGP